MGCGSLGSRRYQKIASEACEERGEIPKEWKGHRRNSWVKNSERALIETALQACCICASCNTEELDELSQDVELYVFSEGDVVCVQNHPGTHFFVVSAGVFSETTEEMARRRESEVKPPRVRELHRGSSFGELALIQDCKQKATVKCVKDGSIWAVDGKTFRNVQSKMSSRHAEDNRNALSKVSLFKALSEDQRDLLVNCMTVHSYKKGTYIVREGDPGEGVFIVKEGELKVSAKGKQLRRLTHGHHFGESFLLHKEAQKHTVVAITAATCLGIGRCQLLEVLRMETLERILFANFITTALSEAFKQFTRRQIEALAEATEQSDFDAGALIHGLSEGEPHRLDTVCFLVVLEGAIIVETACSDTCSAGGSAAAWTSEGSCPSRSGRFKRGDFFGQEYMLHPDKNFGHLVRCSEAAKLALLTKEAVFRVLGTSDLDEVAADNEKMAALKSIYFFHVLSAGQLAKLSHAFRVLPAMSVGEAVVTQGEAANSFYFIAEGAVEVTIDGKHVRVMHRGEYFGERALLFNERRTASVTVSEDNTRLWAVDKQVFNPIVSDSMRAHLEYRCLLQDTSVALDDLQMGKVLGKGMFGVVKLVVHAKTQTRYALKLVSKSRVITLDCSLGVQREREILEIADHPFVIKLVRTFKDDKYLYFLTELLTGGELYQAIRTLGILSHANAQFYFGCLVLSIEYLHSHSITFRDLKPENVLLTTKGYTKLIDFGCARKLEGQRSFSVVGTPHYLGPEVILRKGYRQSADVWSLGVCLYEFLCGCLPFGNDTDDRMEIFKEILTAELCFPANAAQDHDGHNLIRQLLTRNANARIGCSYRGFDEIMEHQFYAGFEWERLLSMDIPAPYIPPEDLASSLQLCAADSVGVTQAWSEAEEFDVDKALTTWDQDF